MLHWRRPGRSTLLGVWSRPRPRTRETQRLLHEPTTNDPPRSLRACQHCAATAQDTQERNSEMPLRRGMLRRRTGEGTGKGERGVIGMAHIPYLLQVQDQVRSRRRVGSVRHWGPCIQETPHLSNDRRHWKAQRSHYPLGLDRPYNRHIVYLIMAPCHVDKSGMTKRLAGAFSAPQRSSACPRRSAIRGNESAQTPSHSILSW